MLSQKSLFVDRLSRRRRATPYGGVGDFHGVAQGRDPSYCECGLEAGIVIR
jgi:hypothetical protein